VAGDRKGRGKCAAQCVSPNIPYAIQHMRTDTRPELRFLVIPSAGKAPTSSMLTSQIQAIRWPKVLYQVAIGSGSNTTQEPRWSSRRTDPLRVCARTQFLVLLPMGRALLRQQLSSRCKALVAQGYMKLFVPWS
jgi:hypothetical protein